MYYFCIIPFTRGGNNSSRIMPRWYSNPLNFTHDGILIKKFVATFRPKLWSAQAKGRHHDLEFAFCEYTTYCWKNKTEFTWKTEWASFASSPDGTGNIYLFCLTCKHGSESSVSYGIPETLLTGSISNIWKWKFKMKLEMNPGWSIFTHQNKYPYEEPSSWSDWASPRALTNTVCLD